MTWNGSGTFNPPGLPEFPAVVNDPIRAAYFNTVIIALCNALQNVVPRDGQAPLTGNLDFNNAVRVINLPAAVANGQAVRYNEFSSVVTAVAQLVTDAVAGHSYLNKGNSGTTAQVIDYTQGEGQSLTATGAFVMSAANFPSGRPSGVLLKAINFGSQMSSTGIVWRKADGSGETTTFSAAGYSLQASGTNLIGLMSVGDGVVYGMVR